jgi:serine/threonine-protein kinase
MDLQPGQKLGDHEILAEIGSGGMGRVFQVRHVISHRVEALKVLHHNLEHAGEAAERFIREIRVLGSLDHPHIAQLYSASQHEGCLLMFLEFVHGPSLDRILRERRLPLEEVGRYAGQILDALCYAHSKGVVHRDIKPANILIDANGQVRLTDFGIASIATEPHLTQTGSTVGSLYYMSPEQIRGEQVDHRADIYSLGVTLYEMVTGKRPFAGDTAYSIMSAQLNDPPTPVIEIDPALPPSVNSLILMALAKDPAQRFQSAEAMRKAVEQTFAPSRLAAPQPVSAPAPVPRAPVVYSSRRSLYILAGALVVAAVLIVAAVRLPFLRNTHAESEASEPTVPMPAPVETAAPAPPVTQEPIEPAPPPPEQPSAPVAKGPQTAPISGRPVEPARPATPPVQARPVTASVTTPAPAPPAQQQPPAATPVSPPSTPATTPAATAGTPAANSAAIAKVRERIDALAIRTGAARTLLQNLRRAQAGQGVGTRSDLLSAEQRLVMFLDQAEAAANRSDAEAAGRALDSAEISLTFLENKLGR